MKFKQWLSGGKLSIYDKTSEKDETIDGEATLGFYETGNIGYRVVTGAEVPLDEKDGLPQKCVANLDTIATIRKIILTKRICPLSPEKIEQIDRAVKFGLALE